MYIYNRYCRLILYTPTYSAAIVGGEGEELVRIQVWGEVLAWLFAGRYIPRLRASVSPVTRFALTGEVGSLLPAPPVILTGVL